MHTLFRASVAIIVTVCSTLAGAGLAAAAVTAPAPPAAAARPAAPPACTVTRTRTAKPGGSWRDTRTVQCGDIRHDTIHAWTVYATGTTSRLDETRTRDREAGTWVTAAEHATRTTGYASGTVSTAVTVIAGCVQTVTRHTVYVSGRVTDTTTVKPVC